MMSQLKAEIYVNKTKSVRWPVGNNINYSNGGHGDIIFVQQDYTYVSRKLPDPWFIGWHNLETVKQCICFALRKITTTFGLLVYKITWLSQLKHLSTHVPWSLYLESKYLKKKTLSEIQSKRPAKIFIF